LNGVCHFVFKCCSRHLQSQSLYYDDEMQWEQEVCGFYNYHNKLLSTIVCCDTGTVV
jgi:hypothetical protein